MHLTENLSAAIKKSSSLRFGLLETEKKALSRWRMNENLFFMAAWLVFMDRNAPVSLISLYNGHFVVRTRSDMRNEIRALA